MGVADAAPLWALLDEAGGGTVGMGLPTTSDATEQLCRESAETLADLAAGSLTIDAGSRRKLLFVVVDPVDDVPVGVTGCTFKVDYPNLVVHVETSRDGLGLTMHSVSSQWTRTELDSSYLGPSARGRGVGTLLSRGRLMFLHLVSHQIPTTVASHIRGWFNDAGEAPFWVEFGQRFAPQWETSGEAELALRDDPDRLGQMADQVLPLTASVLSSLGPVNAASLPAFGVLMAEGFHPTGMFDPIDGGPTIVAELCETVTHRLRRRGRAVIGNGNQDALVAIASVTRFKATRSRVDLATNGSIALSGQALRALDVEPDALLTASPLSDSDAGNDPKEQL